MVERTVSRARTVAAMLLCTNCGGRGVLEIDAEGGDSGNEAGRSASTAEADASSSGGASSTTGGVASGDGGASVSGTGTAEGSASGSSAGGTGAAPDAVGGSPSDEGSFHFLSTREVGFEPTYSFEPSSLMRYVEGEAPEVVIDLGGDVFFLAEPYPSNDSAILLGLDFWNEGSNQWLYSYQPGTPQVATHGWWGSAPWGIWNRMVDAAVVLDDGMLVVLVWWVNPPRSEIWVADPSGDWESTGQAYDDDEMLAESEAHLAFHGVTSDRRIVFSDRKSLLFVDESRQLEVVAGLDEDFDVSAVSPSGNAVLTLQAGADDSVARVFENTWLEPHVEGPLVPQSLTWISAGSVLYESEGEVYGWNVHSSAAPDVVTPRFSEFRPRGRSVDGDFGTAFSVQSPNGWGIAFVDGDSLAFCEAIDSPIRTLQPHVRNGVSGVLFDEYHPEDPFHFGSIHFCAPGEAPQDLLEEHERLGRLLSDGTSFFPPLVPG